MEVVVCDSIFSTDIILDTLQYECLFQKDSGNYFPLFDPRIEYLWVAGQRSRTPAPGFRFARVDRLRRFVVFGINENPVTAIHWLNWYFHTSRMELQILDGLMEGLRWNIP